MKKFLAVAVTAFAMAPAFAADVGVSINVPGIYGRVDIGGGDYGQPQVYNAQPVYIQRGPAEAPPVYLHVPVQQQRNWRRYCNQYGACGQPVYFVQDNWYRNVYTPRYREVQNHRNDGPGDRGRPGDDRGPRGDDHRGNDHRGDDHDNRGNGRGG